MAPDLLITDVDRAVALLQAGGLVALPTETVYGLAALATDTEAVRRIFVVKSRPLGHPLIVHLASADEVGRWSREMSAAAGALGAACWPGPLTLVVRRSALVGDDVTGGRDTVGLRVPAHPMTTTVLARLGSGVAAPSANRFGRVSPTRAEHVIADLGDLLVPGRDGVLDGGSSDVGVESTIVDCTVDPPQILRPGGIPDEHIAAVLASARMGLAGRATGPPRASGMLAVHYAPLAEVRLTTSPDAAVTLAAELAASGRRVRVLDPTGDLVAAAHTLYDDLRRADDDGIGVVVAVLPDAAGLGHAIRDRLIKAAARPHDPPC